MNKILKRFIAGLMCFAMALTLFSTIMPSVVKAGELTPFVAVTDITGVPTEANAGEELVLSATVVPENATNKTIVWSVVDAGSTEAEIDENKLTADWSGTVKLQATIEDGTAEGTDFTKEFTIEVKPVVTGVEITMPRGDTVYRNNSFILNAEVKGAGGTGSVTWTLTGASSTHTGIIDGVLTVGEDETAATLTIRATSDFDPTKYGEKVYKVADPKVVSAIELSGRPPAERTTNKLIPSHLRHGRGLSRLYFLV